MHNKKYLSITLKSDQTIGIDLGTTNSAAAFMEAGRPVIIPNQEGRRTTPSVVAFSKQGVLLVGQVAKRQAAVNPANTFFSLKRFIGRSVEEVTGELGLLPYTISAGANGKVLIESTNMGRAFAPEELSAQVLRKIVKDASIFLKANVCQAVITVPAYFNDSQRQATKDAGRIAGIDVLRIINEPTAASLAYGIDKQKGNETVLVYDLGGGTLDVSILEVGEGVFEVISTSGDTQLGGDDFDDRIVSWIVQHFYEREGIDIRQDPQAIQRIVEAAEQCKIELSSNKTTKISLPFITATTEGPKHIELELSRQEFENITSDLLERCRKPVLQAIEESRLSITDIDEVLLVGGSTRMPAVQKLVSNICRLIKSYDSSYYMGVNPDEVVALGAAVQAGVLTGDLRDIVLLDVTPLSLGLEVAGGLMYILIARNTTVPISKSQNFTTAMDGQTAVEINVHQGEREFARDNKFLGNFRLEGIVPAPRGEPNIQVSFDIDVNGILNVSAQDLRTGKMADIKITGASTLDKGELERMVEESKKYTEEDKIRRSIVDARNSADILLYQTRSTLQSASAYLEQDAKDKAELAMSDLNVAIDEEDLSRVYLYLDKVRTISVYIQQTLNVVRTSNRGTL